MITHKYSIKFFIMRFELDHRTGMMRPKKNEEIYFAQSQGGGLIVDDKKNNTFFATIGFNFAGSY